MRYNKILVICGVILSFLFQKSNAQIGQGGVPKSFTEPCSPQIQCVYLPKVNNDSLIFLDSISKHNGKSCSEFLFNFGISLQANYDFNSSGTWELLPDSSKLWRIHIVSNGAYSNYLIFDKFFLPKGTKLFAYNEDKTQILGTFTYENNKIDKRFSLGPVIGKSVIIEYYQPAEIDTSAEISIETFVHSFKDIYTHSTGSSGSCNINVKCPEGNNWCNQRRSVALIAKLSSTPGHFAAHCSGSLITNERRDGRPYFLTANHCITGQNASDFIFIFNYQSQDCNNPATAPSTAFSISGATVRANNSNSDFALLELSSKPPGNYNVYYSGWNNENERPESGVGIHHPSGDIKKISVYDDKPNRETVDGIKVWELEFDKGVVEPGSSGSPLFNENNLIVGQLLGTYSADPISCSNTDGKALYGRFDISWDEGNSNSSRLREWLNPNATSSIQIQSMNGDDPCKSSYFFQNANDLHTSANINGMSNPFSAGSRTYNGVYTVSGTIETGQNVTIKNGTSVEFQAQKIVLKAGFHAEAGSSFKAKVQPCLGGCNTGVGITQNDPDHSLESYNYQEEENRVIYSNGVTYSNGKLSSDVTIKENTLFTVYPNPTRGELTVTLPEGTYNLQLTDVTGKLVADFGSNTQSTQTLNVSHLENGMYFLKIYNQETHHIQRVVVQK